MRKKTVAVAAVTAELTYLAGRSPRARRAVRHGVRFLAHRARYQRGRLRGLAHRMGRRWREVDASDRVLADRVRSSLGPLEHRLDEPRAHVMAHDGAVQLHGDVATAADAAAIVTAAAGVPGVSTVESHLHVGLLPSDSRPSRRA